MDDSSFITPEQAILNLTSLKGQKEIEAEALGAALDLLNNGYKSDTVTIDALRAEIETLQERIKELEDAAGGSHDIKVK
jgi:peptidoglycan hydrolase CwlO-like protein